MEEIEVFDVELLGDMLEEAAADADAMQRRTVLGKLSYVNPVYLEWKDKQPTEISLERYRELASNPRARSMKLDVVVDIQEFSPQLEFSYRRTLQFNSADWFKHWRASIIKVFNIEGDATLSKREQAAAVEKAFKSAMMSLAGKYVEVADVAQEKASKDGKVYRTPELEKVFASRDECKAEVERRFGAQAASGPVGEAGHEAPDGFSNWGEFVEAVTMLANDGRSNPEIARDLGATVAQVIQARK